MRKIILFVTSCLLTFSPLLMKAQGVATFSVAADTVTTTVYGGGYVADNITNTTATSGLTLRWRVIASDFPVDWRSSSALGICDNVVCYQNLGDTAIWDGTNGKNRTSNPYLYNVSQQFELSLNFTSVSLGTHYITVSLTDPASTYSHNETFVITKLPTSVANINSTEEKIVVYPNPARDELNVVFDANSDVKNIAVYNVIGKVMTVFKVNGDSANLDLQNIPSGIYFVRLFNSNGNVVVTKKFTKQ